MVARSVEATLNNFECKIIDHQDNIQIVSLQPFGYQRKKQVPKPDLLILDNLGSLHEDKTQEGDTTIVSIDNDNVIMYNMNQVNKYDKNYNITKVTKPKGKM